MKSVPFFFLALASFAQAYWMDQIRHQGISPFNQDPSYPVYRNVMGFGAKGDGGMRLQHGIVTWSQSIG